VATCCPGFSARSLSWYRGGAAAAGGNSAEAAPPAPNGGPGSMQRGGSLGELVHTPASRTAKNHAGERRSQSRGCALDDLLGKSS
jgi:hypothetical protein